VSSNPRGPADADARVRVMRIIIAALCVGILSILALLAWLRTQQPQPAPEVPLLSWIGAGFAGFAMIGSMLVPALVVRASRRQLIKETAAPGAAVADLRWWVLYQTRMIVGAALLEGAAMYQAIAFFLEGQVWVPPLAIVLFLGVAMRFPTRDGVEQWIETQAEQARQEMQILQ
jgi:hypothetical protein